MVRFPWCPLWRESFQGTQPQRMPSSAPQFPGQFHGCKTALAQGGRTRHFRKDIQGDASGRLDCHEADRRNMHKPGRSVGVYALGFQGECSRHIPYGILRIRALYLPGSEAHFFRAGPRDGVRGKRIGARCRNPRHLPRRRPAKQCPLSQRIQSRGSGLYRRHIGSGLRHQRHC